MNNLYLNDEYWMKYAIFLAKYSEYKGEIPVGAILVLNNNIIGKGYNCSINNNDPTAHAEIIALRQGAKKICNYRLLNTIMYVTLEPCIMCIGAIMIARIKRLVFGTEYNKKNINNKIIINKNILKKNCSSQLSKFFYKKRKKKKINLLKL
ncbi:MAG: hypothetical protein G3R24_00705 [gamma proteobacterium endosymbiont of Trioza apicalis]